MKRYLIFKEMMLYSFYLHQETTQLITNNSLQKMHCVVKFPIYIYPPDTYQLLYHFTQYTDLQLKF